MRGQCQRLGTGPFGIVTGVLASLVTVACGSTEFAGTQRQSTNATAVDGGEVDAGGQDGAVDGEVDGGGPDTPEEPSTGRATERFLTESGAVTRAVDVVFLVDTSGSMRDETARLEQNMETFLGKFFLNQAGLDFRLFLVGEQFKFPAAVTAAAGVDVIEERVDSHDALDIAEELLTSGLNGQTLELRDGVMKELIIVSDDNATGSGIAAVQARVAAGTARVHGLVGLKVGLNSPTCNIAAVGSVYQQLAAMGPAPGLIQDLCLDDWQKLLDNLGGTLTKPKAVSFQLQGTPDLSQAIEVTVGGAPVAASAFSYVAETNTVTVDGAVAVPGTEVAVTYMPVVP